MKKNGGDIIKELELLRDRISELKDAKELSENIMDAVLDPLIILNADLKIEMANKSFYDIFKVKPDETMGRFIYDLGNRQWDIPKLRKLLEEILPNNASFDGFVIEHDFPNIGKRIMILNARRIPRPPAKPRIILLAIEDITDIDKLRMSFERMAELGLFTKIAHVNDATIIELKKEVNNLLQKFGEKLKYKNGKE